MLFLLLMIPAWLRAWLLFRRRKSVFSFYLLGWCSSLVIYGLFVLSGFFAPTLWGLVLFGYLFSNLMMAWKGFRFWQAKGLLMSSLAFSCWSLFYDLENRPRIPGPGTDGTLLPPSEFSFWLRHILLLRPGAWFSLFLFVISLVFLFQLFQRMKHLDHFRDRA